MSKKKNRRLTIELPDDSSYQLTPVTVVADGAVAGRDALGVLIPVLIIDTRDRPDINDVIEAHTVQPSGDVEAVWGRRLAKGLDTRSMITLALHFIRPIESHVVIDFDIVKAGGLVDQIIRSRFVYLQAGKPGDRLSNSFNNPRILVEVVAAHEFLDQWDKMLHDHLVRQPPLAA